MPSFNFTNRHPGDAPFVCGWAALWVRKGEPLPMLGDYESRSLPAFEGVLSTAFDKCLDAGADVQTRFAHDPAKRLGSVADGRLKLWKTDRGLKYRIATPNTRLGREVVELIRSGEAAGSSFKFRPRVGGVRSLPELEDFDSGRAVQLLRDVKLIDVGPCIDPAYPDATVWLWSGK